MLFRIPILLCILCQCIRITMISKVLRAIIMGAPGSGKGTIAGRIAKDFEISHLASGDLLRSQIHNKTSVGVEAKKFMDKGELVPDKVIVQLVADELVKLRHTSWLLDGFPRTHKQAEALHQKEPVDVVINLDVPFQVIIDRLKGRMVHLASGRLYHTEFNPPKVKGIDDVTGEPLTIRDDDKPEVVLARLKLYEERTKPVLDFYRNFGILEEFRGSYSNEIWPNVHKYLATKIQPLQCTKYG